MSTDTLTLAELQRLTLWKWRYTLETLGFAEDEIRQLLFVAWLWRTRAIA